MASTRVSAESMAKRPSNILFIVWDACRLDYAREHASTLMALADDNLWFDHAIAPSSWSPPSHASLFTGQYPHSHRVSRITDSMAGVKLFDRLHRGGYRCFGVSGNGFVSHNTDLHQHFDALSYTSGQGPFQDGLTIYEHVYTDRRTGEDLPLVGATFDTIRAVLGHDHPIKSLVNFGAVGTNRLASHVEPLQRLRHPVFNPFQPYSYSPARNTRQIRRFLEMGRDPDSPFFVFANYMDTHRPYLPPKPYREALADCPPYPELRRLNDEVAAPWEFIRKTEEGKIDSADIEAIRTLYATEVSVADDHLRQLLDELTRRGLRENTLIVVTADHGENLGEQDRMGRRRMGHHASVSEHLLRVPLVVAHPDLDGRRIDDLVSLKDLYALVTGGYETVLRTGGADLSCLQPADGIVESQYPATGGHELYDNHPTVPQAPLRERVEEDVAVAYRDGWKVVVKSTGERWAWHRDEDVDVAAAPAKLLDRCENRLETLGGRDGGSPELSRAEIDHLEALGYL